MKSNEIDVKIVLGDNNLIVSMSYSPAQLQTMVDPGFDEEIEILAIKTEAGEDITELLCELYVKQINGHYVKLLDRIEDLCWDKLIDGFDHQDDPEYD